MGTRYDRAIQLEHLQCAGDLIRLGSALTFEGLELSEESLNQLYDWIEDYTSVDVHVVYYVTGEEMNDWFGLTDENAYPDDLNIAMIDLNDLVRPEAIALVRFDVGGRWLNDVIDNNLARQNRY